MQYTMNLQDYCTELPRGGTEGSRVHNAGNFQVVWSVRTQLTQESQIIRTKETAVQPVRTSPSMNQKNKGVGVHSTKQGT